MSKFEFQETIIDVTAEDGFKTLVGRVTEDECFDAFVLTCDLGECTLKFDKYDKDNEIKAQKHIKEMNYGEECIANYIDLGVVEYETIEIKKEDIKNDIKIEYSIVEMVIMDNNIKYIDTGYASSNLEYIESKAAELALETGNQFHIMKKISYFESVIKFVKTKKSDEKPQVEDNQKVNEKHKYIFYGIASNE